jgi:hypothetical protein
VERVSALFQTYDSECGRSRSRTALVLEQRTPAIVLDGSTPPFLVWTVEADSQAGNAWEVHGYDERAEAETAAVDWVGADRRISWEQVSPSAVTVLMSELLQTAWR